jgi:predicted PurR-regulated permease PerM
VNNDSQFLFQRVLQLLFVGLLAGASYSILQPFLLAMLWATIIVVATWPLLLRVQSVLWNKRWLAVAVMLPASMLCLIVPLTLAVLMIVQNSDEIANGAKPLVSMATAPPPPWVEQIPLVGSRIAEEWHKVAAGGAEDLSEDVLPLVRQVLAWFVGQAGSLGMMIVQFSLALVIAAILYMKGERAAQSANRFARRLGGVGGESMVHLAIQAIRGVALGVIGTAFIQAVFAGIGLGIAGVSYAAVLTAIMVVLGIAQVGGMPVLVPAVIWLYWTGHPGMGTFLLIWTVVTAMMDNVVRPVLIKKGVDLPILLITAGVIGGLIAFGAIGLFVGPVVLAVSYTLLVAWIHADETEVASGL